MVHFNPTPNLQKPHSSTKQTNDITNAHYSRYIASLLRNNRTGTRRPRNIAPRNAGSARHRLSRSSGRLSDASWAVPMVTMRLTGSSSSIYIMVMVMVVIAIVIVVGYRSRSCKSGFCSRLRCRVTGELLGRRGRGRFRDAVCTVPLVWSVWGLDEDVC